MAYFSVLPEGDVVTWVPISVRNIGKSTSSDLVSYNGVSFSLAGAAAAPAAENPVRVGEVVRFWDGLAFWPVASAALRSALAMGCEIGCHGVGLGLLKLGAGVAARGKSAAGSGIDSSRAASVGSGFASGSFSSSNAADCAGGRGAAARTVGVAVRVGAAADVPGFAASD